jgi:TrkA domain protein
MLPNIRESDLPGIGRKFQITTRNNDRLVVVIHDDGRRELYHFLHSDLEECASTITLSDTEARQVAGIIGGLTYKPKALESVEIALDQLIIEWIKVEPGSQASNQSIADLGVRQQTGATIIALVTPDQTKINPGPEEILQNGVTLVVAGEREQIKALKKFVMRST